MEFEVNSESQEIIFYKNTRGILLFSFVIESEIELLQQLSK